jgi:hypothetical protein
MGDLRLVPNPRPSSLRPSAARLRWLEEIHAGKLTAFRTASLRGGYDVVVWMPACESTHEANWLTEDTVRMLWRTEVDLAPLGKQYPIFLTPMGLRVLEEFRRAALQDRRKHKDGRRKQR